jgi:LTXXQ motif family protein
MARHDAAGVRPLPRNGHGFAGRYQTSVTVSGYFFREGLLGNKTDRRSSMLKIIAAGVTALFVIAAPLAYAEQAASQGRLSASDLENLTDARIEIVKAALQLTPDQEKLWPPIEEAIRARAKDRQARIAIAVERARELRDRSRIEVLRDRNPIEFMKRRADRLAQRSADLKRLVEAWEPLYQTLTPEQRRRMAFLAIIAVREMRDAVEDRRVRSEDDNDEE